MEFNIVTLFKVACVFCLGALLIAVVFIVIKLLLDTIDYSDNLVNMLKILCIYCLGDLMIAVVLIVLKLLLDKIN
jgi:hypothetical protein